jgi:hypothetical protein
MNRFITNLGLFVFLIISVGLIIFYFDLLYEKIKKPTFKNLDTEGFLIFGVLIGLFVVADFFIIKRFVKGFKREVEAVKKEVGIK